MTIQLTRRAMLAGLGTALAAPAVLSFPTRARAATVLTLGHGAAPGNPRTLAAARFSERVKEKTEGRITINVAGSETLGSDAAMLTSLRTGALDLTANSQGPVSAIVPEIAVLGLPFLFTDASKAIAMLDGPVGEALAAKFQAVGIVPLGYWDNGIRHLSNSKREVKAPGDVSGLKVRTPADPMTIDIFQALGASTEQIAFGELYVALQQGVVDGQENPLANIASSKLYEVNRFIALTAHKWESTPFLMSQIAMARIGGDLDAVKAAAAEAGQMQRELSAKTAEETLAKFRADGAITVTEVDRAAFVEATKPVAEAWKQKDFGDFVSQVEEAARG
ncbi:TRAP transporter substrate-binding protein [Aureimonas phyllosphaerae]|uniref:Tripartite ATP-independent transporter DctP family solute receptor n=1 Tax=Aureimonas phyllosphaerae TaxID=1166078 RepID=A0A7W6BSN8_9HYPH|nr:TRAP transporter substrate-binding protein [Aureimonas phyllosphaerae]MBB3937309.1 tripartite ATP-independent transporter DctP family solute receptor [Aureimonas phyllosphaerae]MBB3961316.1 tripartite ATP-independent transporter DctP family solute receptor [Aureimonas phyllosphaerae]SFF41804.1 tripartite ATP-independent transporter solute receptor, DctP family [Aureimonas phyllosphaerae]